LHKGTSLFTEIYHITDFIVTLKKSFAERHISSVSKWKSCKIIHNVQKRNNSFKDVLNIFLKMLFVLTRGIDCICKKTALVRYWVFDSVNIYSNRAAVTSPDFYRMIWLNIQLLGFRYYSSFFIGLLWIYQIFNYFQGLFKFLLNN